MDAVTVDAISAVVVPVVQGAGLYCEQVVLSGAGKGRKLTVTVDLPADQLGGVDMDKIAELSRELSRALDEADAIAGAYQLEVTTPGVGRPLSEARHFLRARGRLVKVETDDGVTVGRVRGVRGEDVVLACADTDKTIELAAIRKARIQVEFTPPPRDFAIDDPPAGTHGTTGRGA